MNHILRPLKNVQFCSSSRKAKILNAGIHRVFRGLKFESDAEIGQKGAFCKGLILLTIDVEDWFQVENFKQWIPFSSWSSYKLRVEKNTHQLLDLLDSQQSAISGQRSVSTNSTSPDNVSDSFRQRRIALSQFHPRLLSPGTGGQEETEKKEKSRKSRKSCLRKSSPKATFFVLGWIAERLPNLVREIRNRGHEVASHGYNHCLCNQQSYKDLEKDLEDSKKLLEDITGHKVYGYRAPSFAINNDILKIIEDCGYLYDSSYNSFALHERYGQVDFSQNDRKGIAIQIADPRPPTPDHRFYELPISNLKFKIKNLQLPWGGGGYFRLIPLSIFKKGVKSILNNYKAYIFYMHPWEIDSQQPHLKEASSFFKFRHYVNLHKNASKLSSFIKYFSKSQFVTCHNYLTQLDLEAGKR